MSVPSHAAWLAGLSRLSPDDMRRISRLVDLLTVADRATADTARIMLDAHPEPVTAAEARRRCDTIVDYLERVAADDYDVEQAEQQP